MKRPVVMILLAGALTLSVAAPSVLPAAGNLCVVQAAEKTGDNSDASKADASDNANADTDFLQTESGDDSESTADEQKDKTETVYVDANADGSVKKITVKDWLRRNGDGEIIDFSNLKDIKNTEGDETYTQNGDGTITWENKGEDISYEGTSDQQLPVTTKVTYYLDGKEIKPSDLAGKSGKVKIRFDYTNNESRNVNIDGKNIEVNVPFLAASVLMLPGDKFKNVKVSGGKIMADQDQSIVIGTAFPGLSDSLKLKDYEATEDIDLKDYVEVTADVENFALDFTATAISTCGLSDEKNSNLDDVDDMIDGVKEMNDASDELVDAMGQLRTGAGTLKDYLGQYTDGVSQAASGAQALAAGLSELDKQVTTLMSSLSAAGDDSKSAQAVGQIKKDMQVLAEQLGNISAFATQANTIAENVNAAKNELEKDTVKNAANDLEAEASEQAKEAAKAKVSDAVAKAADAGAKEAADSAKTVIAEAADQAAEGAADKTAQKAMQKLEASTEYQNMTEEQKAAVKSALESAADSAAAESARETKNNVNPPAGTASESTKEQVKHAISYDDVQVKLNVSNAHAALGAAQAALGELQKTSIKESDLTAAGAALADLQAQFTTLSSSFSGMPDISNIGGKLQSAISQLAQGAAALGTGTSQLSSAGTQLNTGMGTLVQGSSLLEAGMKTFDKEGIDKLGDLAGDDLANVLDHFKAVKEAEKTYINYGGIKEGASGSVKFIVETAEIK